MKSLILGLLIASIGAQAKSLIECQGMNNENAGIVRLITDDTNTVATDALISTYGSGTANYKLKDIPLDLSNKRIVDYYSKEAGNLTLKIDISNELLSDGSTTIRPFFYKSTVYFTGQEIINSRFFKCRIFKNL